MTEEILTQPLFLLEIGALVLAGIAVRAALEKARIAPAVGYILIGVALRAIDDSWHLVPREAGWSLQFLAMVGATCLLFRVGLESDLKGLVRQLPWAVRVWISDVIVSGGLGFLFAYFILGEALIPSLFVATALSATSVGVTLTAWQSAGALRSSLGEKLLDVAELDDLSAITLMVLLLAAVPALQGEADSVALGSQLTSALGVLSIKGLLFVALCLIFSVFLEKRFTAFASKLGDPVLALVGASFVMAALAGWLGFSTAIGGLFAGLLFSRDPVATKMETAYIPIYDLFTPFFFFGVGLQVNPGTVASSLAIGLLLLIPAVSGKFLGAGLPALPTCGAKGSTLLGVSMLPRAEISLLVMMTGLQLGNSAVSDRLYGGIVTVSLVTCLVAPQFLRVQLARWPQQIEGTAG